MNGLQTYSWSDTIVLRSFGHVFLVDTGTSNGDIMGPTKAINSCDFRPARPFRVITGSEDNSVAVFEGITGSFFFYFLIGL